MSEKKKLSEVQYASSISTADNLIAEVGGNLRRVSLGSLSDSTTFDSDLVAFIEAVQTDQGIYTFDELSEADGSSIGTCRLKSTDPTAAIDAQIPAFYIKDGVAYKVTSIYWNGLNNDNTCESGIAKGINYWPKGDTYMTSISLPKTITSIPQRTFFYLSAVKKYTFASTVKFTNMFAQFLRNEALTVAGLPTDKMNTSEAKDFGWAFFACTSLEAIPDLDYSAATTMQSCFQGCTSLTSFSLTAPALTNATYMCYGCTSLTSFSLTAPALTNATNMLYKCSALKSLTLSLPNATNMAAAVQYCTTLESIDISAPKATSCNSTFAQNYKLKTADVSNLATSAASVDFNNLFNTCSVLTEITFNGQKPKGVKNMIYGTAKLTTINGDLDFSSCTNMAFGRTAGSALTINGTWSNIKTSVSGLFGLDHDSAVMIINGLTDLTGSDAQTLTLPSALESEMTESEIEIATNKNWTVAFG